MNLIPFNSISQSVEGDTQMNGLQLHPHESLVISSEDIRCMFYLFALPPVWYPFLGINRPVPDDLVPPSVEEECYLVSRVLPMGYLNSVGIAQHLHRNLLKRAQGSPTRCQPWSEVRKDRTWSLANPLWRVYLDNLDILEKTRPELVHLLDGDLSQDMSPFVDQYHSAGIPLNAKKSVKQAVFAEVQGAEIDGEEGFARPKGEKIAKYVSATLAILDRGRCTQREMQVVAGGLVYFSMFRRPLMGVLNFIWRFIQSFEITDQRVQMIPKGVQSELLMFLGMLPLAHMDFRYTLSGTTTASDASLLGGGVCATEGVSTLGEAVAALPVRGDSLCEIPDEGVVVLSLFDGISAARVALEVIRSRVLLHVSVESDPLCQRVVESNFADVVFVEKVEDIDATMVQAWACRASSARLVLVTAGPPCQGVSALNRGRRGAEDDPRSSLHSFVQPIVSLVEAAFPWCRVHFFQESVASMDTRDREVYTRAAGVLPYMCCASGVSPCRRDRLYWFNWGLNAEDEVWIYPPKDSEAASFGRVVFESSVEPQGVFEPGWGMWEDSEKLPTFTTSQPSKSPRQFPSGLEKCSAATLSRWAADRYRFPPYQYREGGLLYHPRKAEGRLPNVSERERCLGFPLDYTFNCFTKSDVKGKPKAHEDARLTLLGNTWSVPVVAYFFIQLLRPLRLCSVLSFRTVLETLFLDTPQVSEALLSWRAIGRTRPVTDGDLPRQLTEKLVTLVSAKGEDVMLQVSGETRHPQRFRRTIPPNLWRWKEICGWRWRDQHSDHINRLELRAIYTALRWRLLRRKEVRTKFLHLTDSMVCLHVLNRGRSSSSRIQTLLYRIGSLMLASGMHACVSYVATHLNPADRPRRRARVKKRWLK